MQLSLEQLGRQVGCTKSYLSSIETGRRQQPPSHDLLVNLEQSLGLKCGELLEIAAWKKTPQSIRHELERIWSREQMLQSLISALQWTVDAIEEQYNASMLAGAGAGHIVTARQVIDAMATILSLSQNDEE